MELTLTGKMSPQKHLRKYLALPDFLGNQGLKGIWENAHLSPREKRQALSEPQLSTIIHL